MIFSFVDITLQMLNQIPISETESLVTLWFGFEKIYLISDFTNFTDFMKGNNVMINYDHLKLLVLKCFTMFFIFLQSRIYESESFDKFLKRDLRKLITLANT